MKASDRLYKGGRRCEVGDAEDRDRTATCHRHDRLSGQVHQRFVDNDQAPH